MILLTGIFPKGTIIEKYHSAELCKILADEYFFSDSVLEGALEFWITNFVKCHPNYSYMSRVQIPSLTDLK